MGKWTVAGWTGFLLRVSSGKQWAGDWRELTTCWLFLWRVCFEVAVASIVSYAGGEGR